MTILLPDMNIINEVIPEMIYNMRVFFFENYQITRGSNVNLGEEYRRNL